MNEHRVRFTVARRGTALLAMAASALAGWQLLRGLAPPGTSVSAAQAVDRGVAAAVLAVGAAVAAWYLLTAAAVLVAVTLRRFGAAPRALDRAISRFGAPLLRRAAMFTAATSLTLGAPAWAGPPVEPPGAGAVEVDAGSAPWEAGRNASVLIDLGWAPSPAQPFARTHPAAAAPPREAPPPAPAPPPAASNASTASTTPA